MNIKIIYKKENSQNINDKKIYEIMCTIIKKDIKKQKQKGDTINEEEYSTNKSIN